MRQTKEEVMAIDPSVISGAKLLIQRCLGLTSGQSLLIFSDETTNEVASIISKSAEDLSVQSTIIFVPISVQQLIPREIDLSLLAQGAAREARAILTCVNSSADCLPFRKRILETQWSARTRIGHMPGASPKVLQLANVDFSKLIGDCHNLEIALARGKTMELVSQAFNGDSHHLRVDIGGWERLPVASDGVIADGVWGNVPSGETYIAPIEGSAKGSVVINGSIPGLIVKHGEQIVLYFEDGCLSRIEPDNNRMALFLQEKQIKRALNAGDKNWCNLAEIGIGQNPAVKRLTGNMLFDEKAAGTAHIALGSNSFMGGKIDSVIHCDMVIKAPTIMVDGKTILKKGKLCFIESDWRETYSNIVLSGSPLQTTVSVSRSGTDISLQNQTLSRILRPEPGRVSTCAVGNDETSRLAHDIYNLLPRDGEWIEIRNLFSNNVMNPDVTRRVLHLMWEYGLINYC
jgi:leucyl aminopeptidase (aminopeptidase T)